MVFGDEERLLLPLRRGAAFEMAPTVLQSDREVRQVRITVSPRDRPDCVGEGPDVVAALRAVRLRLEADGALLWVNGARRTVHASGMQRDLAGGRFAYVLPAVRTEQRPPSVDVLGAPPPDADVVALADQDAWYDAWLATPTAGAAAPTPTPRMRHDGEVATAGASTTPSDAGDPGDPGEHGRPGAWLPALVLLATVAQLAVAEFVPGIDRFADKAFGARLVAYPLLMLAVPAAWWVRVARRTPGVRPPYGAFTLVMLGFLVDTTGNTLDLYDSVRWWDDANHFVNWFLLLTGLGLLVGPPIRPPWARVVAVAGLGSLLALAWEIGEWWTFIRHGTELATAYEDTLGDLTLGTCGAVLAALLVAWHTTGAERRTTGAERR